MTGARRIPRHVGTKLDNSPGEECGSPALPTHAQLPRHCSLPDIPQLAELPFQVGFLANTIILLCFQYINLYHTIWWLPYSRHKYAVDFDAIDTDVLALILMVLSHRLLKLCVNKAFERVAHKLTRIGAKATTMLVYYLPMILTFVVVSKKYPYSYSLLFLLPSLIYFLLFGPSVLDALCSFFPWLPRRKTTDPYELLVPPPTEKSSRNIYHACSMSPEHIRREVFILRTDFNYRLKLVYFESMMTVYYGCFIPFLFCKDTGHLNMNWVISFMVLSCLTTAVLCFVHRVPAQYIDTLHKSSLHLGRWIKMETRNVNIPHSVWSELTVWPKGILVKHVKGLFKADGINNAAEPGNSMHYKFYMVFSKPEYLSGAVTALTGILAAFQFTMLVQFKHWYQLLATTGLMLTNYYSLFVVTRDFFILNRVYRDEKLKHS